MRPVSAGDSRTGSVTSTVSVASRASSAAPFSASRRAAIAAVTRSFKPLISGPCSLRCSGVIPLSVLSSADTDPLLPSADTRTASSAASSEAASIAPPISCSSVVTSLIASLRQRRQIGGMRLAARLREHAVHLPAMVRLMIEHVREQHPFRFGDLALLRARIPGKIAVKVRRIELVRPCDHRLVEFGALALEPIPFGIERDGFRDSRVWLRYIGEAAHPDLIAPEQVAQRLVDRAEERTALAPPLLVGERIGHAIEIGVLPAIVARHAPHIGRVDHRVPTV